MVSGVALESELELLLSVNSGDARTAGRRGMSVLCGRSAWARVVARTLGDEEFGAGEPVGLRERFSFGAGEPVGSRERFSFVVRMPERDAVMCPRAVAGPCG